MNMSSNILTSHLHQKIKENERHYNNMLLYRYASQVSVGDEVLVLRNDELMPVEVVNVSSLIMQGKSHLTLLISQFKQY